MILSALALLFAIWATSLGRLGQGWPMIVGLVAAGLLFGLACGLHVAAERFATRTFLLVASLLAVTLRGAWIVGVPTVPVSDFASFHAFAEAAATGGPLSEAFAELVTHGVGYPAALGLLYSVVGPSLLAAKILNVALVVPLLLAAFAISRRLGGEGGARLTVLLLALWPSQIMMSSVLATEHLFTPLAWAAFALVLSLDEAPRRKVAMAVAAGGLLGLSSVARPVALIALVACALFLLLRREGPRLGPLVGFVVGFLAVVGVAGRAGAALGDRRPYSGAACSLLFGTNHEAGGQFNVEDSRRYFAAYSTRSPAAATREIYGLALGRMLGEGWRFPSLMVEKLGTMWADGAYGAYWSLGSLDGGSESARSTRRQTRRLAAVAQTFHVLLVLAAFLGLARCWSTRPDASLLIALLLLVLFAAHTFLEAQARYHLPWDVGLAILAGVALQRLVDRLRRQDPSATGRAEDARLAVLEPPSGA